ncbi:MAG: 2OG-Fe(II) oxygenase, partial [Proteobacteria bacterium]|nr:2OG-Fe(II) oxygenase [Pseudomonadota bacterium]
MFEFGRLLNGVEQARVDYRAATPFPHIVIDDFLTQEALVEAIAAFPPAEDPLWQIEDYVVQEHKVSHKKACNEELRMPVVIRRILRELNSSLFLRYLSTLTEIANLLPDPAFVGSGMFLIEPGGFLNVHADFNVHFLNKLDRRLNLLLYLNLGWQEEYGGHLELWQQGVARPTKSVLPIANRCVIFSTTDHSFHGHPRPLTCPPGRSRNCLSLYYYSN